MAWFEVEFSAVEIDGGGEVVEVAEASGGGFDPLDFGIQAFAHGVGDLVFRVGQEVVESPFAHLRFVDHRLRAAVSRPVVPLGEILASPRVRAVILQRQRLFLDHPDARRLEIRGLQRLELAP